VQTILLVALIQALAGVAPQPGTPAGSKPQAVTPGNQPAIVPPGGSAPTPKPAPKMEKFQTAEALLAALETADASVRSLTADLVYDRTFALQGDRQLRKGKLYFLSAPTIEQVVPARRDRKFAIRFDELYVGSRQEKETKFYIFDGIFLVEKLPEQKVFVKRQIAQPGQPFDPLKIGEGPLPIPIGQKKNEILARFNAELLPSDAGIDDPKLKPFVASAQQLRLTPRPELERDSEFREIRLWYQYDKDGALLPRMAKTLNQAEDESLVQLINVKVNGAGDIPTGLFDTTTPPDGWDVKVQPWREGPENVEYVNGPQVIDDNKDGGKPTEKPAVKPSNGPANGPGTAPGAGTSTPGANPGTKPAEQPKAEPSKESPAKPATTPQPGTSKPGGAGTPK